MYKKSPKHPLHETARHLPWIAILICVSIFIAGWLLMYRYAVDLRPPQVKVDISKKEVSLYFSSRDGTALISERALIKKTKNLTSDIGAVIELLIRGSKASLIDVIPDGTRLLGVKVRDNIAIVDFSEELKSKHWGGSSAELVTIYSIVNSVTQNFHQIDSVQILINGKKSATLAGHIIIDEPLGPDRDLIKG